MFPRSEPVFNKTGKKWLVENQKNNHELVIDDVELGQIVYMYACENCTMTVKGKLSSIILDKCKKTSVVFDTLISTVEFINCTSVKMQVLDKVPTISIDKTDGCQIYLSDKSLDVEIVSSKSSEMNVYVPKENGQYDEYAVPQQFKSVITVGKGLHTTTVERE